MPDGQFISPCWKCKCEVWLPTPLYKAAKHSSRIVFFCPYGHEAVFSEEETEVDKLRRERDRLKQDAARLNDEIEWQRKAKETAREEAKYERARANGYKGHATRITRRAKAGMCPCCRRTFSNMADHMRKEHPTFTPLEEDTP